MSDPHDCHESVPPDKRQEVIEEDNHRCRFCGNRGPGGGGVSKLHIHHIERAPPEPIEEHGKENLTTLCRGCHNWVHKRTTTADLPFDLSDAERQILLPHDFDILRVLAEQGPSSTGEIVASITPDHSSMAVRERLWILMGIDQQIAEREQPLVDQDATTKEWGLPHQIDTSIRGQVPSDSRTLIRRVADERVRRALARGCSREEIAEVFDVHQRTTRYMERRARAFAFPLDVVGKSTSKDHQETSADQKTINEVSVAEYQQQLDVVANGGDEQEDIQDAGRPVLKELNSKNENKVQRTEDDISRLLEQTISTLEAFEQAI